MAIETAIATGLTPTSIGNVSFEVSGFGTPQAAIIYVNRAASGANPRVHAALSCGFTDGTLESTNSFSATDAVGTMVTDRYSDLSNVINLGLSGSTSVEGSFSSWATNGITINFGKVSTIGFFVTVVLIKGCTNVKVGSLGLGTGTSAVDINTVGFKPNLVFTTCTGNSATSNTAHAILSLGVAHNNSSDVVTQGQVAFSSVDGGAAEVASVVTRDDSCTGQLHSGAQSWRGSASAFDSSGFSITPNASAGSDIFYYLAIDTGDADGVDISVINSPTATGTLNVTDPAFEPQLSILFMGMGSTTNTIAASDPMAMAVGVFNETTETCHGIDVDDAASTSDTQSNYATSAVQVYSFASGHTLRDAATLTGFTANGYDLNFTTAGSVAKKWLSISIESSAAPTGRLMSSLANHGCLAGHGGIAGIGGGLAG